MSICWEHEMTVRTEREELWGVKCEIQLPLLVGHKIHHNLKNNQDRAKEIPSSMIVNTRRN